MKKRESMLESSLNFDNEVTLPPLEKSLYIVLEATPKNDQWLVLFAKAKWQVPNSIMSFSNLFHLSSSNC